MHDEMCGTQSTGRQIKFNTMMLKSSLCDYSDSYILVKGNITIAGVTDAAVQRAGKRNK